MRYGNKLRGAVPREAEPASAPEAVDRTRAFSTREGPSSNDPRAPREATTGPAASPPIRVFDTWVTSSLTPQITPGWPDAPERHARLFPFDVRAQSHEIIRTCLRRAVLAAAPETLARLEAVHDDVALAARAADLTLRAAPGMPSGTFVVEEAEAPPPAPPMARR